MKYQRLFFVIFFSLQLSSVLATNPMWQWSKLIPGYNIIYNVGTTSSGTLYVTGTISGQAIFGSDTIVTSYTNNLFIAQYNSSGAVNWVRTVNTGNGALNNQHNIMPADLSVDFQGNVYVCGSYSDTIVIFGRDTIRGLKGMGGFFLAKYDSLGNYQWVRSGQSTGNVYLKGLANDNAGNAYMVAGCNYDSTIILGVDTFYHSSGYMVASYDKRGNLRWYKSTASGHAAARDVCADSFGHIYVSGYFPGTVNFGTQTITGTGLGQHSFVASYDTAGNPGWATSITSGTSNGYGNIVTDSRGNTYSTSVNDDTILHVGSSTIHSIAPEMTVLSKVSPSGSVIWVRDLSSDSSVICNSLAFDGTDRIYACGAYNGFSRSFDNFIVTGTSQSNSYLAAFDTAGNAQWAANASTSRHLWLYDFNTFYGVGCDKNGNAYVTTLTNDTTIVFGRDTLVNYESSYPGMYILSKISACSSIPMPMITSPVSADSVCLGRSTTLTASGSGLIEWFNLLSGGTSIGLGTTFVTPSILNNTTYYVQDSTCAGASRIAVDLVTIPHSVPILSVNLDSLMTGAFASYKWLLNGNAINGATGNVYLPQVDGDYQVIVTNSEGCEDTSVVYHFNRTGLGLITNDNNELIILPNPSEGHFVVKSWNCIGGEITIEDLTGREVLTQKVNIENESINATELDAGIYVVRVTCGNRSLNKLVTVSH